MRLIVPIVEGYGDVQAVPILLRRLRDREELFQFEVGKPVRAPRSALGKEGILERHIQYALKQPGCEGVIVLIDADDDCPAEDRYGPGRAPRGEPGAR